PELRVDGARLVSTGAIDAGGARHWGLEGAVQRQGLLIQGEYFDYAIDRRIAVPGVSDPTFNGWYIEAGYVLTGEARKYNTGTAAFDAPSVEGPWGAWELVGRYSVLDLDHHEDAALAADRVLGGEQTIWSGGVNWFVNPLVKFGLHYLDVSVERWDGDGEQAGQDLQAVNLRSQFAF
ncbi:MAG TPA: porin, partial [Caulobacteraceae bacterium]|nr:porin [Caulobacteraceae bacterium]